MDEDEDEDGELVELISINGSRTAATAAAGAVSPLRVLDDGRNRHGVERRDVLRILLLILLSCAVAIATGGVGYRFGARRSNNKNDFQGDVIRDTNTSIIVPNKGTQRPTEYNTSIDLTTTHKAPELIFLLGERNSGTKYVEKALVDAFYPRYSITGNYSGQATYKFAGCSPDAHPLQKRSCAPVFKFKHMFRHLPLSEEEMEELRDRTDILWILVVRSPCDWADAMYRKPWQMCNPSDPPEKCRHGYIADNKKALKNVSRLSFFDDLPWLENTEARFEQDFIYPGGVFDLRAHKLGLMSQLRSVVGPHRVKLAHLKYVETSPESFVQDIAIEFGLEVNEKRAGLRPSDRVHRTMCLSDDEWRVAEEKIDWMVEGEFGFNRLDCHTCV